VGKKHRRRRAGAAKIQTNDKRSYTKKLNRRIPLFAN